LNGALERFPIMWRRLIESKSAPDQRLEHRCPARAGSVRAGDASALFGDLGLEGEFSAVDASAASRGDALLSAAGDAGWLVMGAFRRGRFLDWLFGSVSETVLRDAAMPVFLAH
jgi:hypothetical protein